MLLQLNTCITINNTHYLWWSWLAIGFVIFYMPCVFIVKFLGWLTFHIASWKFVVPNFTTMQMILFISLLWRHNWHDNVSNHQPHDCLLNHLFRRRSKKTSKLRATGLCAGYSPGTGEFPTQKASNAENVSIWWRHHVRHTTKQS